MGARTNPETCGKAYEEALVRGIWVCDLMENKVLIKLSPELILNIR